MITKEQARMARAALGIGVREVAKLSGLSGNTDARFGNKGDAMLSTVQKITDALEKKGIKFLSETETDGPGVRLHKSKPSTNGD